MGPFKPPWKPQVLFPVVVVVVHREIALRAFDDNNNFNFFALLFRFFSFLLFNNILDNLSYLICGRSLTSCSPGCRTSKSRVSFPVQGRSTRPTDSSRSCASVQSAPPPDDDKLSFAVEERRKERAKLRRIEKGETGPKESRRSIVLSRGINNNTNREVEEDVKRAGR